MTELSIDRVGKSFRSYASEWQRFMTWFGLSSAQPNEHWILRDISFSVKRGEAVAIVGENGAGKSTLLKLIAGTLYPTEGNITRSGKVAAILELGMGFNPEITGRENALHAATMMGLDASQIAEAMPIIEDFAEIGDYFNEPVRVYSSGMQMRLAFSVATALRPDILIIDEALSVGDTYFQHKSFSRIRQFREKGTSLLFVSHDRSAVIELCDRAILISSGGIEFEGSPEVVMDFYNARALKKDDTKILIADEQQNLKVVSGNSKASVSTVTLVNSSGQETMDLEVGDAVTLRIVVCVNQDISNLVLGYQIKDRVGQVIFGTNTHYTGHSLSTLHKGERYQFDIEFCASLGNGTYSIATALVDTDGVQLLENYEWNELQALFNVTNSSHQHFVGTTWLPPKVQVNRQ